MFIMFLAAWGCWLISNEKAPFQLVIFVPALAFFISHFILLFKQKTKAEIFAVTLTAIIISLNYYIFNDGQYLRSFANFNVLNTHTAIYAPWTTGKKVLVLGDDKSLYYGSNTSSIKYYNWQIGQSIWLEPSTPAHAAQIYSYLSHEQPETIVDQNQLMPAVSEAIPSLKLLYKQVSSEIYLLKNPTE
jgi:hypothetical protein